MNPTWQHPPRLVERCFVVVALFFFMGGMIRVISGGIDGDTLSAATRLASSRAGSAGVQAVFLTIYLVTFALIRPKFGLFLGICRSNKALLLLFGIAAMSVLWSADPAVSLRRLAALVGLILPQLQKRPLS